jgi:hypothetical protein
MAATIPATTGSHSFPASISSIPIKPINFGSKLKETPVETYQQDTKVPEEFLVTDPKKIPNRKWGDDDDSKPNFEYPLVNLAPLLRLFANKPQPGDEDAATSAIEVMGKACEEFGFFQVG